MQENTVRVADVIEFPAVEASNGYEHADELRALIDSGLVTQSDIARELGCSPAKVSQYCKKQYNTVALETLQRMDQQIGEFLLRRARRNRKTIPRKELYLSTSHAQKLESYLDYCHLNNKIRIIRAGTGMGKSHVFRQYQQKHDNVFVQVCRDSRRAGRLFVADLYKAVMGEKLPQDKKYYEAEDAIFEKLHKLDALLILDDAHKLSVRTLNLVIELYDSCERLGIVLGDQSDAQDSPGYNRAIDFDRNPQILRRIGGAPWSLEFDIGAEDVALFCEHFGISAPGVRTWLANVVNLPKTRYDWLSEIVTETVCACESRPELLEHAETFERVHLKLRGGK
jgi:predicted transcriptional regulator